MLQNISIRRALDIYICIFFFNKIKIVKKIKVSTLFKLILPLGKLLASALYADIDPHTATRPRGFIWYIIMLLISPPTCEYFKSKYHYDLNRNLILFNHPMKRIN